MTWRPLLPEPFVYGRKLASMAAGLSLLLSLTVSFAPVRRNLELHANSFKYLFKDLFIYFVCMPVSVLCVA